MKLHRPAVLVLLGLAVSATLGACGSPREEVVLLDSDRVVDETAQASSVNDGAMAMAGTRAGLRVVGSSTVFPFTTAVAENFGAKTVFPTPVVEATGTGGGMNLFCSGLGPNYPDLTGASRPIKASEFELCEDNGVTQIAEIQIGFDGIVLGNAVQAAPVNISKQHLFLALVAETPMPVDGDGVPLFSNSGEMREGGSFADLAGYQCDVFIDNPFQRWSDISPDLPTQRIEVFGPPPTSGTRDAFVELGMHLGALRIDCLEALSQRSERQFDQLASRIREDGAWIDAGENDNTIVQTLANTPNAFGLFGYSFLEQNGDRIQATLIDGVEPSYDNIANGVYPISRSLFVYAKNQHEAVTPGLREFVEELTSEDAWGPFGYLSDRGLIALPDDRRADEAAQARALQPMQSPQ